MRKRLRRGLTTIAYKDGRVICSGGLPLLRPPVWVVHCGDGLSHVCLAGGGSSSRKTALRHRSPAAEYAQALRPTVFGFCLSNAYELILLGGGLLLGVLALLSLTCAAVVTVPATVITTAGLLAFAALPFVWRRVKRAAVFYDLTPPALERWDAFVQEFPCLPTGTRAATDEEAENLKSNAGCEFEYQISPLKRSGTTPRFPTNASGLRWVAAGRPWRELCVMPDGIHLRTQEQTAVHSWDSVDLELRRHEVPGENPLDRTPKEIRQCRKYVNLDGTQDFRWARNPKLSVWEYWGVRFRDEDGRLDELLLFVERAEAHRFHHLLKDYVREAVEPYSSAG